MKINFYKFLNLITVSLIENSDWYRDGYRNISFNDSFSMKDKKLGDFAWVAKDEIVLNIPDGILKQATNIKTNFKIKEIEGLERRKFPIIGCVYVVGEDFHFKHKKRDKRLIYLTSGQYYGNGLTNGGVSNYWFWKDINADGTLGKENSGYGNFYEPPFKINVNISVSIKEGK